MVIDSVHLEYVVGHPSRPEKVVDITQGPDVESGMGDLGAIESVVHSYVSEEGHETYSHQGNFHRDWNEERLRNTAGQQATIQAGGMKVEVNYMSWDEPQRVILARLNLECHILRVVSMNVSWAELQDALTTLSLLKGDQETLADYQQGVDELRRKLYGGYDDEQAGR